MLLTAKQILDQGIIIPSPYSQPAQVETTRVDGKECWVLEPGTYAITFNEGCKIPANAAGFIIHRSSLYRTGTSITSPVWDPGFETQKMGTVMIVNVKLIVEKNARVAQMFIHTTEEPAELYDGQFQGGTHSWEKKK